MPDEHVSNPDVPDRDPANPGVENTDLSHLLGQLEETSAALHQERGSVDEVIRGVEKKLQDFDTQLEVWLDDTPLRSVELSVSASNVAPSLEVQIGYAPRRSGSRVVEWRLQLREAEYAPRLAPSGEYAERELMQVRKTMNLIDASAEDRMSAMAQITLLIQRLTELTRQRTQTILQAKKLLD